MDMTLNDVLAWTRPKAEGFQCKGLLWEEALAVNCE